MNIRTHDSLPGISRVVWWISASEKPMRGWLDMHGKVVLAHGERLPLHCFHSWCKELPIPEAKS